MSSSIRHALIFVHGFLGSETSFDSFPKHLQARLPQFECIHFPNYDSRHCFDAIVEKLIQFIHSLILQTKKSSFQTDFQCILLGHSLGGWIAAEACVLSSLVSEHCLGVLAFDTPFFKLHSSVYPNARSLCTLASALAPFRFLRTWLFPSIALGSMYGFLLFNEFLTPLFSISFSYRCHLIQSLPKFRCFYPVLHPSQATFIQLPPAPLLDLFIPIVTSCTTPISAHMSMFDANGNASAYGFLLAEVVSYIREWCPKPSSYSTQTSSTIEKIAFHKKVERKKERKKRKGKKIIKIEV